MRPAHGEGSFSHVLCCVSLFAVTAILSPLTARAGDWVLPDSRVGIRTAPLLLLTRPDVQADLRLDPQQIQGAMETINELTRRASALKGKTGAQVLAERRAIDESQLEWLGQHLNGNQLERLRQIELQWEGVAAMLSRPSVAEYLKLTPEQRQGLARIIAEQNAFRQRTAGAALDERAFALKARALLNAEQLALWGSLLGTPLHFAATAPRNRDDAARQAGHQQAQP